MKQHVCVLRAPDLTERCPRLLLPTWLRLERDEAAGIAIVPMSPAALWWTIMKCGYKRTPAPSDAFELCH